MPPALLHHVKHKVLHARVIITTVAIGKVPSVPAEERLELRTIADGIYRVMLR